MQMEKLFMNIEIFILDTGSFFGTLKQFAG